MQDTSTISPPITIILGIPGPWTSVADLADAIALESHGFALRDGELINTVTDRLFHLELVEYDPELRRSFELANRRSLSQTDLDLIGAHKHTAYVIGRGGSLDAARGLQHVALLDAGGFGVKVETSGVAHSARDWQAQTARRDTHVGALYIAYVALVGAGGVKGEYYSCGMHNLGLCDAIVSAGLSAAQAGELLRGFLMRIIHEQPLLISGQTIVNADVGGRFRLAHEPCRAFPPDAPFHNPFGLWRLSTM